MVAAKAKQEEEDSHRQESDARIADARRETACMSWAELDWPDLSPAYPEPHPLSAPPPRPPVPADIAAQVRTAEHRRGIFVPICALAGAALFGVGLALYHPYGQGFTRALAIMGIGLVVAFVVPALAVLLVIGPHWRQRLQHLQLMRWERERRLWLARERYLSALSAQQRNALRDGLAIEREPSPRSHEHNYPPYGKARARS